MQCLPTARCRGCGYDLSALPGGKGKIRCPECGRLHDPLNPYAIQPWPDGVLLAVRLSWPSSVVALVEVIAALSGSGPAHAGPGALLQRVWPIGFEMWWGVLGLALAGLPMWFAARLVTRYAHPREALVVWFFLAVPGVFLSAAIYALGLLAARALQAP